MRRTCSSRACLQNKNCLCFPRRAVSRCSRAFEGCQGVHISFDYLRCGRKSEYAARTPLIRSVRKSRGSDDTTNSCSLSSQNSVLGWRDTVGRGNPLPRRCVHGFFCWNNKWGSHTREIHAPLPGFRVTLEIWGCELLARKPLLITLVDQARRCRRGHFSQSF